MKGKTLKQMTKKVITRGVCSWKDCEAPTTSRAKWCVPHKKQVRKLQLQKNNATWRERAKKGLAGHHLVYNGRATVWTLLNPQLAEEIADAHHSILESGEMLRAVIRGTPIEIRKEVEDGRLADDEAGTGGPSRPVEGSDLGG